MRSCLVRCWVKPARRCGWARSSCHERKLDGLIRVAPVDGPWAAQSPTTLRFTASYQGQNPPPTAFYLGDSACQTMVVTPPAAVPSSTGGDDGSDDDGNSGPGNNNGNGNGHNRGRGNSQAE